MVALKSIDVLAASGLALVALGACAAPASAQYAYFAQSTDTIRIEGDTQLGTTATYEAVVKVLSNPLGSGMLYNEHMPAQENKSLWIGPSFLSGYAWPNSNESLYVATCLHPGRWIHVAYVNTGAMESLYVDGMLLTSRSSGSNVGDSSAPGSVGAIGAVKRVDVSSVLPSFIGLVDSFRVSNAALYSGPSFTPPSGDLPVLPSTVLLFNFNEAPGSTTIADESPMGMHGTLGVGFSEATAPVLGGEDVWTEQAADLDCDGRVDGTDLGILLGSWGSCSGCRADVDGDGDVSGTDLGILLGAWTI
ncbi:MAG: LamG-like jellyroll fold domain-containing protein [Phycisphaerales bacterium]